MIFDIITLPNSNQAVIVDKTYPSYLLKHGDWYYREYYPPTKGFTKTIGQYKSGENLPSDALYKILASREPIPGVYLLPEWVWSRKTWERKFKEYDQAQPARTEWEIIAGRRGFQAGYEAAGGYTREQMMNFPLWISRSKWRLFEEKDNSYTDGISIVSVDELLNDFMKETQHPRQLDITLPVDEKGVVKVNNVIY